MSACAAILRKVGTKTYFVGQFSVPTGVSYAYANIVIVRSI